MPRYLALTPHLTTDELHDRHRHNAGPVVRSHYPILWRLSMGQRCPLSPPRPGAVPSGSGHW